MKSPILSPMRCWMIMIIAAGAGARPAMAQEWTRFRGPNGSGLSSATTVPVEWTENDYNWKIELPGNGHGSPVLWGEKIFLMSGDRESARRMVLCIDVADGKLLWNKEFSTPTYKMHKYNEYASSTPTVDENRVYVCWASPEEVVLLALDHEGKQVWRKNLGPFVSRWGSGTSPMLYEDMVIISNDQQGEGFLLAVDAATGEERWKIPRGGGRGMTCYAVPVVYRPDDGKPQLIFASRAHGFTAADPQTGRTIWEIGDAFPMRVVASPVIAGDLLIGTCGSGGAGERFIVVKPGGSDPARAPELLYEIKKSIPYVPTPIVYNHLLFLVNDGGVASCLEPSTGEVKWRERIGGNYFGSPVCVNGVIYCLNWDGEVVVFKASDRFELLARNPLGELSYATPAVCGGRMYLRTQRHLISIGG